MLCAPATSIGYLPTLHQTRLDDVHKTHITMLINLLMNSCSASRHRCTQSFSTYSFHWCQVHDWENASGWWCCRASLPDFPAFKSLDSQVFCHNMCGYIGTSSLRMNPNAFGPLKRLHCLMASSIPITDHQSL